MIPCSVPGVINVDTVVEAIYPNTEFQLLVCRGNITFRINLSAVDVISVFSVSYTIGPDRHDLR